MKLPTLIIILAGLLLVLSASYTVYRESTDPILFKSKPAESIQAEPIPAVEESVATPEESTEEVQVSLEEKFDDRFTLLTRLMESQLVSTQTTTEDQLQATSAKMETAAEIVGDVLVTYREKSQDSLSALNDTLSLIGEMNVESEAISDNLNNAKEGWDQLFNQITSIGETSANRLNQDNFEFQNYTVKGPQTLLEIASDLKSDYNIPESDLSYLLGRFNEIDYRMYDPGGRRPSYRVVANETLKVPVPKTAGDILTDNAIPDQLQEQIAFINRASQENENLQANLSRQVGKLKQLEAQIYAIESLANTLENIDFETNDTPSADDSLSPEMQQAWLDFENAATAFRISSGSESELIARQNLDQAITRLLEEHENEYLYIAEPSGDPLEYYLMFIEKYRP